MSYRPRILKVLALSSRPMWLGEISEALGMPFDKMECLRVPANELVYRGIAIRFGTKPSRIYYALSESARSAASTTP